ncbi:Protein KTI12/L-seryl-tRNA(Sec) kinase, partial [Trinorchestia longiramus]
DRASTYNNSSQEKTVRASVKAAVLRSINENTVVIVDASNYIKGYRYELYCVGKQHSTPHCVVQCVLTPAEAWQWNTARPESEQYDRATFDALVFRYEAPDSRNRQTVLARLGIYRNAAMHSFRAPHLTC